MFTTGKCSVTGIHNSINNYYVLPVWKGLHWVLGTQRILETHR